MGSFAADINTDYRNRPGSSQIRLAMRPQGASLRCEKYRSGSLNVQQPPP